MEINFDKSICSCLRRITDQVQTREQTQEVRLPDAMPDIGRVLGSWGQVLIRGKEWRSGSMSVSGGVMAWVLYAPEDGSEPRSLDAWIPFQMKWDLPETEQDGFICVMPRLKSLDARSTAARKLMIRANLSLRGQALEMAQPEIYAAGELPEDVQLLKNSYPMELPRQYGEKTFQIDEELTVPAAYPAVEKILHYDMSFTMTEQKVMASRLVFRGKGLLHILYSTEGKVHSWDSEVTFSQFADLDQDFGPNATAQVIPVLTNLELDAQEQRLMLKCGLAAQYTVYDRVMVELCEDAYSPVRTVAVRNQELNVPMRLDQRRENICASQTIHAEAEQIVEVCWLPDVPQLRQTGDAVRIVMPGLFQVLYYDPSGNLQSGTARYEQELEVAADSDTVVDAMLCAEGRPQATAGQSVDVSMDYQLETSACCAHGQWMVTGLELGDVTQPDPGRPSLVLRRCQGGRVWDIAKVCGSTVEAIYQANGLSGEPEKGRMLLIPVS